MIEIDISRTIQTPVLEYGRNLFITVNEVPKLSQWSDLQRTNERSFLFMAFDRDHLHQAGECGRKFKIAHKLGIIDGNYTSVYFYHNFRFPDLKAVSRQIAEEVIKTMTYPYTPWVTSAGYQRGKLA